MPRSREPIDGASRTRTGDLVGCKAALSQLSYGPSDADCRSLQAESLNGLHQLRV